MMIADLQTSIRTLLLATIASNQISQTELAQRLSLTQSHICNFLNNRRGVSIQTLDAMLRVLNLQVDDILPNRREFDGICQEANCSAVPVIKLGSSMLRAIADSRILELEYFTKPFLERIRSDASANRKDWLRFVVVKMDARACSGIFPQFDHTSVILIDRHYCSLKPHYKGKPNLYLVRWKEEYLLRHLEMHGASLCLRPVCLKDPLEFIPTTWKKSLDSFVVGRIAHIAGEV